MAVFEDGSIGLQAVDAYILFNLTLGLKLGAIIGPKLGQELILLNPPLLVHDRVEDAVDADHVLVAKAPVAIQFFWLEFRLEKWVEIPL